MYEFKDTNLNGANLSGLDLYEVNFESADMLGTNLSGADLRGANFSYADMRGADLRGADLRGAILGTANLEGANCVVFNFGKHCAIVTNTHVSAGCVHISLKRALKRKSYKKLAKRNGYTKKEIKIYGKLLKLALKVVGYKEE